MTAHDPLLVPPADSGLPVLSADDIRETIRPVYAAKALPHYVVFTDGSGSTPDKCNGFAAVTYAPVGPVWHGEISVGCFAFGTSNEAEGWALIPPLERIIRREMARDPRRVASVLVVTDSENTTHRSRGAPKSDLSTISWDLVALYRRHGLAVTCAHLPRDVAYENRIADWASRACRLAIKAAYGEIIEALKAERRQRDGTTFLTPAGADGPGEEVD